MENTQQAKIKRGPPRRRDESFQTLQDIVIPAGTILRHMEDDDFAAPVGVGSIVFHGTLTVTIAPGAVLPSSLKRVVAL